MRRCLALALLLTLTGVSTAAPIIFNGGGPNQANGNEMTAWVQAEDFALTEAAQVTDGHFWSLEGGAWDGTLTYYFFADAGGQPAAAPFATGAGQNVVKVATGNTPLGLTEFEYSFDLATPLNLAAGTPFWFGLHLSTDFNRDEIYWETTGAGFGVAGNESLGGTFNNWSNNGQQHAFNLTGQVPEPASMLAWSLLTGVGLIGYRLRRRKV